MDDAIFLKKDGPLRWLVFNRPEKRNAVSLAMAAKAQELVQQVARDDEARVLIVTGSGGTFVAGADISEFEKERHDAASMANYRAISHGMYEAVERLEKPTIAMIEGFCLGGGMALAVSCDLRVCADDAVFGIPAAKLGIAYTISFTRLVMNLAGPSATKEILYTGRRYTAQEAKALGLVNAIVPKAELENFARGYAEGIARNAPLSVRAAKLIIEDQLKSSEHRDPARCEAAVSACADSEDFRNGRRAFMEKRTPIFTGR